MRLIDVIIGRLFGLKYKMVYCFKLVANMVEGGIRELMYDTY